MKIKLTFKTPDVIEYADFSENIDPEDQPSIQKELNKWIEYGEYAYLEYDTETKQMIVLKP